MVLLYLLLVVIAAVVNGESPALRTLNENLKVLQEETAKVEADSKSLHSELQNIQMQIDERARRYESGIRKLQNKTDSLLKNLDYLALIDYKLEKEGERRNQTLARLVDLNTKMEFALRVVEEDFQLLRSRQQNGGEAECWKFQEDFKMDNNMEVMSGTSLPLHADKIAPRVLSQISLNNDTAEIAVTVDKIDAAKIKLLGAIDERKRLQRAVEAAKHSLNKGEAGLKAEIEKNIKRTKYGKNKLNDYVVSYQNMIAELDRAIRKESEKQKEIATDWLKYQNLIQTVSENRHDCYQRIQKETEWYLQGFERRMREFSSLSNSTEE